MRRACVPAGAKPVAHFQPHARVTANIADVSGFHAVLCDDPELLANASVAYRRAARLARSATGGFKESIPGRRNANSKPKLNWRIEQIFLKQVNNPMFHYSCSRSPFLHLHCLRYNRSGKTDQPKGDSEP